MITLAVASIDVLCLLCFGLPKLSRILIEGFLDVLRSVRLCSASSFFIQRASCIQREGQSGCLEDHAYEGGYDDRVWVTSKLWLRKMILPR